MNDYLQCLYDYIMGHLSLSECPDGLAYHRCAAALDRACAELEDALSPSQLELVESYLSALSDLSALEDELLFQRAVELGKWMSR